MNGARSSDQPRTGQRRRVAIVVHASVPGDPRIRRQADTLLAGGYEVDVFALRDRLNALRDAHLDFSALYRILQQARG